MRRGQICHAPCAGVRAPGSDLSFVYDANGNLTQEVQRDANNNVLPALGRTEAYTSFNMPTTLASPSATLSFVYGPDHQRIKQIAPSATTIYLHPDNEGGLSYEKDIHPDGSVEHRHFITADGGVVALVMRAGVKSVIRTRRQP